MLLSYFFVEKRRAIYAPGLLAFKRASLINAMLLLGKLNVEISSITSYGNLIKTKARNFLWA